MTKLMRNPNARHIDFYSFRGLIVDNPNVHPSNLDMIFERKSKFLIAEWKRDSEQLSLGQEILLKNLAKQPNFIVLIVIGDTDEETNVLKFDMLTRKGNQKELGTSLEELRQFITKWYNWANKK